MRHIDVYLSSLERRFGKPRAKFPIIDLEIEFRVRDITEMVRLIANSMFPLGKPRIQVAQVRSGGPKNAMAWLQCFDEVVPRYGTKEFEELRVSVRIRNELIDKAPFQTVSFAIAHEFAHLVLFSVGESKHDEKYVDLLAMHFGFAELYEQGKFYDVTPPLARTGEALKDILSMLEGTKREGVGYLTEAEVVYARKQMVARRAR